MAIRVREVGNVSIIDIEGNIDINSSDIVETVGWLVNSGKVLIALNLEGVDLVDYSGLSILAIAYKNVINHNGKMKFIHVALPVIELFKLVRLDHLFETYATEEDAISSFNETEVERLQLRRKFKRLDIHMSARYRIISGQKEPKTFSGDILNISGVGLYIYTPYIFPINSLLEIEFKVPGTDAELKVTGRVIWHADKKLQMHACPGMGVSFTHLTPKEEQLIIDFIEKNATYRSESF
jgi:anti-sigma B factor antagonist